MVKDHDVDAWRKFRDSDALISCLSTNVPPGCQYLETAWERQTIWVLDATVPAIEILSLSSPRLEDREPIAVLTSSSFVSVGPPSTTSTAAVVAMFAEEAAAACIPAASSPLEHLRQKAGHSGDTARERATWHAGWWNGFGASVSFLQLV